MTGLEALAAMGALSLVAVIIVWAVIRAAARAGAAEENAAFERRLREATEQAAKADLETLGRMADADAASATDTADAARERMRKRPATTR